MILLELVLQNFGPYRGRQVLDLRPGAADCPIILIGGMNGGGKTTLLDALRLALYGGRSQCSTRRGLSYGDFLSQCVHYAAPDDAIAGVELAFEYILNGIPKTIRVQRTWSRQPKGGKDTLDVSVDDWADDVLVQTWDEWIETVLPLGISSLFLFDGEQIKELAEQAIPPAPVVEAIRAMLGLELADRLALDLDVLTQRKQKSLANTQELHDLEKIEHRLAEQKATQEAAATRLEQLKMQVEQATTNLQTAEANFRTKGGDIASDRPQLEAKLASLQQTADDIRNQLCHQAAAELPLLLIQPLLQKAQAQGQKELRRQQIEMSQDLIAERDQKLLDILATAGLSSAQIQSVQAFLTQENTSLEQTIQSSDVWLGADANAINHLTLLLNTLLPNQQQTAQNQLKALEQTLTSLDNTERLLAKAASPEVYAQLKADIAIAQTNLDVLQEQSSVFEKKCDELEKEIISTHKELTKYSDQILNRQAIAHFLSTVAKAQATLVQFRQNLTLRKLADLETSIRDCFLYLLHKNNLVQQIDIDPETFSLSLYGDEGKLIPKQRISAGEKQILAVAILWGLARASGRRLPIAIDTPLGRLDSSHRENLVERYFPDASHQVILLSR
ncbi:DNA sulfur modification protein DndD [Nodosilinea nodulosa]|uniref:DNA sulfur modification protein DndD n=1 Tax=Nodosilinea nodulosa TaxID=416001 RepID=UPI00030C24AF|nr:DNA sulfur modification protein DndD [Nodosilinea nodulosa]